MTTEKKPGLKSVTGFLYNLDEARTIRDQLIQEGKYVRVKIRCVGREYDKKNECWHSRWRVVAK